MIARKPKLTEEQFLRGTTDTRRGAARSGSNGSIIKHVHFRLPDELYERLRDLAYDRRTNVNALMVGMLEEGLMNAKGKK